MVHDGTGALVAVAVDGPSGSGKSSTARGVAERLGWNYVDTGAMYRALTWWLIQQGVDVDDPAEVARRVVEPTLDISADPRQRAVFVNGQDVSAEIRDPGITSSVSAVSAVAAVRKRLVEVQREIMERGPVVVEGRDIGTVVAPDAAVKVFLVATTEARAARRAAEWAEEHDITIERTAAMLDLRDQLDSTRELSPLTQAEDAVVIDSTELSLDEVIDRVIALVRERVPSFATS
ncbi:MAG TPA: (d)CMP kinase [Actinomycetes bacterium]|nr:(d)CMP kinase [Actinomycetes bacterium]